jgi:hypothetical protein
VTKIHVTAIEGRIEKEQAVSPLLILKNGCVNDVSRGPGRRGSGGLQGCDLPCFYLAAGQNSKCALECAYFTRLDAMEALPDAEQPDYPGRS